MQDKFLLPTFRNKMQPFEAKNIERGVDVMMECESLVSRYLLCFGFKAS